MLRQLRTDLAKVLNAKCQSLSPRRIRHEEVCSSHHVAVCSFRLSLPHRWVWRRQDETPLSPPASAECKFSDGKTVKIDYSSPRAKGRKIFGGLVPYGQIWRTGANESTTFVTDSDIVVGGQNVPAGSYTIFTVPEADKWTLVISKKTGEWGTDYPGESNDLARVADERFEDRRSGREFHHQL